MMLNFRKELHAFEIGGERPTWEYRMGRKTRN